MDFERAYRLPLPKWPRAVFRSDYSHDRGELLVDGKPVLSYSDRGQLARGIEAELIEGVRVRIILPEDAGHDVQVFANGRPAPPEEALSAPTSRSAWLHATVALVASGAGLAASYLYLLKAQSLESAWALKMAYHMAGWHLLLTITLFPASVWGQRVGIRIVQFTSFAFFVIHLGIALANTGTSDPTNPNSIAIAVLNALSGLFFLIATIYGQRAHRDMDPVAVLLKSRPRPVAEWQTASE